MSCELFQQFVRGSFIVAIWNNAHLKTLATYQPGNNGWVREDNLYHFRWFELPNYVSDSLKTLPGIITSNDKKIRYCFFCLLFLQKLLEKMTLFKPLSGVAVMTICQTSTTTTKIGRCFF